MTADQEAIEALWRDKLMHPAGATWEQEIGRCVGCRRSGLTCRYGISREWREADKLLAVAMLGTEHEGGPGVGHGGVVAALLDEVMGHLPWSEGHFSVTKRLEVRYLRPIPLGEELRLWATGQRDVDRGEWHCQGAISVARTGKVVAEGAGTWVERDFGHYLRFQQSISM